MSWAEWAGATFPEEDDVVANDFRSTFVGSWSEFFGAVFPHPDRVVRRDIVTANVVSDTIQVTSDGLTVTSQI